MRLKWGGTSNKTANPSPLCRCSCGTIKVPPYTRTSGAERNPKFCSHSPSIVAYSWKPNTLRQNVKQQTNIKKHNRKQYQLLEKDAGIKRKLPIKYFLIMVHLSIWVYCTHLHILIEWLNDWFIFSLIYLPWRIFPMLIPILLLFTANLESFRK